MKKKILLLICPLAFVAAVFMLSSSFKNDKSLRIELNKDTVVDVDGNVYHTIKIGKQTWMVENLKTTKFNDSTSIPNEMNPGFWGKLKTPAWCWYNNTESNKDAYGAFYNAYAILTGKLCPKGWHVPTKAEWFTLIKYLGGETVAAGKMKETGTVHWITPNRDGSNTSGFTALPGGLRTDDGTFNYMGYFGYWWSAPEKDADVAWTCSIDCYGGEITSGDSFLMMGYSVRCIKD
jgi:uncharacterized protein (TIGR02145 family)